MKVEFAFGKQGISVEVPECFRYQHLETLSSSAIEDVPTALAEALEHPISSRSLRERASGKKSAAIAICDITRPAPNSVTLPPLLRVLSEAGISKENITIFIATGLHRPATAAELEQIAGAEIVSNYSIVNHYAREQSQHRNLGTTKRGTPIEIDERFVLADLHITLGLIEQHLMLGFSGGRKLIAPGLAGERTIKAIHSPRFMQDRLATEGSIENNPLHGELLEIARTVRHDFILDVTLTQTRQISGIFCGCPVAAHAAGVQAIRANTTHYVSEPFDAVVTSAAGFPLDLTFYQTVKGITATQKIMKPGGRVLILSECAEGIGSPEFAAKLRTYTAPNEFLEGTRTAPVEVDQWVLEKLALADRQLQLLFFTPGVAADALGSLGSRTFGDVRQAIDALLANLPDGARIGLIPDGPYVHAALVRSHDSDREQTS